MPILWIICFEVSVPPGVLEGGNTLAYTNVVTWGETPEDAVEKVLTICAAYKWTLLNVERVRLIDHGIDYGEELNDLIDQAAENPNAILYGTFFSYKVN
jgi:hypothetical protein